MSSAFTRIAIAAGMSACMLTAAPAHAAVMMFSSLTDFLAMTNNTTLEDFEGAPWTGAPVFDDQHTITDQGLVWSSANFLFVTSTVSHSAVPSITDQDPFFGGTDHADLIRVDLPAGFSAFGVFLTTAGQNHGVQVIAYDAAENVLVDAITIPNGTVDFQFFGVASEIDIAHIKFISTMGPPNDDFALDDFYFGVWNGAGSGNVITVSEPGALGLFACALTLFAAAARNRRRC